MKKLLITLAAAALIGGPLAAQAQDRDGFGDGYRDGRQADGHGGYARPAGGYGRDADARAYDRRGDTRYDAAGREGYGRDRFAQDRFNGDRGFYRDRVGGRFRGEVGLGFGYGGDYYDGGGYYDAGAYPAGGYGADDAYSYPDQYGTYQPFAYGYSARDDAYYAEDGGPGDGGGYDGYAAAPNVGWSPGGPPADCGRWIWREGRGAYQWVPAPCPYPQ